MIATRLDEMIGTRLDEIVRYNRAQFGRRSGRARLRTSPPLYRGGDIRCARGWRKSGVGAKWPNGSATTYVENFTPSESHDNRPRRSRRSGRWQSPRGLR